MEGGLLKTLGETEILVLGGGEGALIKSDSSFYFDIEFVKKGKTSWG